MTRHFLRATVPPVDIAPGLVSRHYCFELPQLTFLLLKNRSLLRRIRYALFKRWFSTKRFIDSFGGGIR